MRNLLLLLLFLTGCASVGNHDAPAPVASAIKSELAPTGILRVGLNLSTTLLAKKDLASGELRGVAIDIASELARRIGVPVHYVGYATGQLDKTIGVGEWDIAFFAIEASRAEKVNFSPPYAEIETTYLVKTEAVLRHAQDVDRDGITVAVPLGAGYESTLVRILKHAKLLRTSGVTESIKYLSAAKVDAVTGLKPQLVAYAESHPGFRVLDGRFAAVQQAIGIQKGRHAADQYLHSFMTEIKQSGFVVKSVANHKAAGLTIPQ